MLVNFNQSIMNRPQAMRAAQKTKNPAFGSYWNPENSREMGILLRDITSGETPKTPENLSKLAAFARKHLEPYQIEIEDAAIQWKMTIEEIMKKY